MSSRIHYKSHTHLILKQSCNPKHPDFAKTGAICKSEGINDTLTRFRWRVSAPSGMDGVSSELRDLESNTFFASTHKITLDSIYFGGGQSNSHGEIWKQVKEKQDIQVIVLHVLSKNK